MRKRELEDDREKALENYRIFVFKKKVLRIEEEI